MDTRLKQRVIGAVVLTALAIIILPMLLDGSAEHRAKIESAIPEPPAIEITSLNVNQVREKMVEMEAQSATRLPEVLKDEVKSPEEAPSFSLNDNGLPISWSLKLGSFKNKDNATRLRQSLRDANYRCYIISTEPDPEPVYRVYVGPMLDKLKLQAAAVELQKQFDLKGTIVRYRIEDDRNQLGG